ncbi:hypothetical protein QFC24_006669 [Naganishia onofrii]|uniref:Uncharacterized protein n=1 Tax=Naganishia onofrii TaxID=1851511 RepID=A0ACC2WZ80_9TREE|nr:hypothetical protein QFC24_006669 [Naganishia onofrii]
MASQTFLQGDVPLERSMREGAASALEYLNFIKLHKNHAEKLEMDSSRSATVRAINGVKIGYRKANGIKLKIQEHLRIGEEFCDFVFRESNQFYPGFKARELYSYAEDLRTFVEQMKHTEEENNSVVEAFIPEKPSFTDSVPHRHNDLDIFCLNITDEAGKTPSMALASIGVISGVTPSRHQTTQAKLDENFRVDVVKLRNETENWESNRGREAEIKIPRKLHAKLGKFLKGVL